MDGATRTTTRNDASVEELDRLLAEARLERESLREKRLQQEAQYEAELSTAQEYLNSKHQSLCSKLKSQSGTTSIPFYMQLMKEYHLASKDPDNQTLPPVYIHRIQASLLQAMHHAFLIFPAQEHILYKHERRLTRYLHKQWDKLERDLAETDTELVDRVSLIAQENHECYDEFQKSLDSIRSQIRELEESESGDLAKSPDDETIATRTVTSEEDTSSSNSLSDSRNDADPWFFHASIGQLQNSWNAFASDHLKHPILTSNDRA